MAQSTLSRQLPAVLLLALLASLPTAARAQQPAQQTPADPGAPADLQTLQATPQGTFRVNVRRVVVDVVVTDAKGKPIAGLTRDDFRLFENGKPVPLRSFEPHVAAPQPPLTKPQLPVNTFSNLSLAPQTGPPTVILYDLLNTPPDAQPYAHAQLLQFLKQRKVSSQVAVFVLSDKLHLLQGFTDDEDQLLAALNVTGKTRFRAEQLQESGEATQASDQLARTEGNNNAAADSQDPGFQQIAAMVQHMETIQNNYFLDERVRRTDEAFAQIARFLVGLPGRKNLLWLSGAFPAGILPNGSLADRDTFEVTRNYSETVMKTTDLLNLAHVAVYPVDVRGLQVNPMFSAASNATYEPGSHRDLKAVQDFTLKTSGEHATMDNIADQTGGRAFYNTNGLKEAETEAVAQGSVYYTLSYAPPPPTAGGNPFDGSLRRVKVQLSNPALAGARLDYRRSYFNDDIDSRVADSEDTPTDPLGVTLQHGAPAAHELFFEAHLQTFGAPTAATPEQIDVLAQYEARATDKKPKPGKPVILDKQPAMMQRYVIVYGLLLRQLSLTSMPDGTRRGSLDFAVMAYNDDGLALDGIRSKVDDVIQPERYKHLVDNGYQVVQTVAVPVGTASLRLAVRDTATGHLGSMEIKLPLAPQPAAAATAPPSPTPSATPAKP